MQAVSKSISTLLSDLYHIIDAICGNLIKVKKLLVTSEVKQLLILWMAIEGNEIHV
jgi:hypothetical protein